jgi:hypothetical protein
MKQVPQLFTFAVALSVVDAFGGTRRRSWYNAMGFNGPEWARDIRPSATTSKLRRTGQYARRFPTGAPEGASKEDEALPVRRNFLKTSAAFLSSALLGTAAAIPAAPPEPAQATEGSLPSLTDAESLRIDIFERTAPSVVFIDTFAEKQDVFSPNAIDVPLGTGTGYVWDKEGHIGKSPALSGIGPNQDLCPSTGNNNIVMESYSYLLSSFYSHQLSRRPKCKIGSSGHTLSQS